MFNYLINPLNGGYLVTLVFLEIVLSISNAVFISALVDSLPNYKQLVHYFGLVFSVVIRVLLLSLLAMWVNLNIPCFYLFNEVITSRDVIFQAGGLFLIARGVLALHVYLFEEYRVGRPLFTPVSSIIYTILQVALLDLIFSLDSVFTAVAITDAIEIMILAVLISLMIRVFLIKHVTRVLEIYPSIKLISFLFLIMVGFSLISEGTALYLEKKYLFFAIIILSIFEIINIKRARYKEKAYS